MSIGDVDLVALQLGRLRNDFNEQQLDERARSPYFVAFQPLPALRGLWLAGSADNTGAMYDRSGQGRTLTYNGNPVLALHNATVPYWDYDGAGDYHSRADEAGLDVLGTETYVASSLRGLTFGGWFWFNNFTGNPPIFGKYNTGANQRSFLLFAPAANTVGVIVDSLGTGAAGIKQANSAVSISTGAWHFILGRFTPSTELAIFVNGTKTVNTTSIVASVFNGTAPLVIGSDGGASVFMTGRCALAFLCAAALPDGLLNALFQSSRVAFGV